jgi:hypothetical protein
MKRFIGFWLAAVVCVFIAPVVFAQVTNTPPAFDPTTAPLPSGKTEFWTWAISIVTPLIVYGFGKIPQLPRPVLPILTPVIGVALGLIMRKLVALNLSWVDMAQAGAVAVFIRESVNQLVTKQMKPLEDSKTNAKPVDGAVAVDATTSANKP